MARGITQGVPRASERPPGAPCLSCHGLPRGLELKVRGAAADYREEQERVRAIRATLDAAADSHSLGTSKADPGPPNDDDLPVACVG